MKYIRLFIWSWKMNKDEPFSFRKKMNIGFYAVSQQIKWNRAVAKAESLFTGDELETAKFALSRGFSYKGISV